MPSSIVVLFSWTESNYLEAENGQTNIWAVQNGILHVLQWDRAQGPPCP
jgi:hypothetical protein